MKRLILGVVLVFFCVVAHAQSSGFEWADRQDAFQAGPGQSLRIPIKIKNTSDRPQYFVIRKAQSDLGTNQKGYFCQGDDCFDPAIDQFTRRLEVGEATTNLYYVIETGMISASNSLRFEVYPRGNPTMGIEHSLSLSVDEKPVKSLVFQSRDIVIHDVYPNPVIDQAFIDYKITNEMLKAKVVIHNILGSPVGNYELPVFESRVKIQTDELTPGVYFYTVYLNNVGVLTHKLIVRK